MRLTWADVFMTSVEKLLSISSEALSRQAVTVNLPDFRNYGSVGDELLTLLEQKNGFYAFESALHVFPAASFEKEMTLSRWNSFGLWRHQYGELVENLLCFAEDAFGNQFCIRDGHIASFDAETGQVERIAGDLMEWAGLILADYNLHTGYPVAHQWQIQHGALPIGKRLALKVPLVLGGNYSLDNLYAVDAVEGMRFRGDIVHQIKDLPDGSQVQFRITRSASPDGDKS